MSCMSLPNMLHVRVYLTMQRRKRSDHRSDRRSTRRRSRGSSSGSDSEDDRPRRRFRRKGVDFCSTINIHSCPHCVFADTAAIPPPSSLSSGSEKLPEKKPEPEKEGHKLCLCVWHCVPSDMISFYPPVHATCTCTMYMHILMYIQLYTLLLRNSVRRRQKRLVLLQNQKC